MGTSEQWCESRSTPNTYYTWATLFNNLSFELGAVLVAEKPIMDNNK